MSGHHDDVHSPLGGDHPAFHPPGHDDHDRAALERDFEEPFLDLPNHEEQWFEEPDQAPWLPPEGDQAPWLPPEGDQPPWLPPEGEASHDPVIASDAIAISLDESALVAPVPVDDGDEPLVVAVLDDLDSHTHSDTPGDGDSRIALSGDPGGIETLEPIAAGLLHEPSWEHVPNDNGAVGAAAMGLAVAAAAAGVAAAVSASDAGDRAKAIRSVPVTDAAGAVALLHRLGAQARLEHGRLDDLRSCVDGGGTVLLTGTDGGAGRHPLALVAIDDERGMAVFREPDGPQGRLELPLPAFQQAWDDTAGQMVVAGDEDHTVLLPVTVAAVSSL